MAGAPLGNQNAANGKKWKAAIDRALESRSRAEGKEILDELANVLINQALAGEQWAVKEFGDRVDGKAHQTLDTTVKGDLAGILSNIGSRSNDPPLEG